MLALGNLHRCFGAQKEFELVIGVFDLQENKIIYQEVIDDEASGNDMIKSQLYALFLKIKNNK